MKPQSAEMKAPNPDSHGDAIPELGAKSMTGDELEQSVSENKHINDIEVEHPVCADDVNINSITGTDDSSTALNNGIGEQEECSKQLETDETDSRVPMENGIGEDQNLPEEKKNEDMDILGNGKLIKKVLREGDGQPTRPQNGELVTLRVKGTLDDGTIVDVHDELEFIVGDGDVAQALDLAAALMEMSEIAEVTTACDYAYGIIGREPDIPADATIKYELEVLKISKFQDYSKMTILERMQAADVKRQRGNWLYARHEFHSAIKSYSKAIKVIDNAGQNQKESVEDLQRVVDCRIKCFNNLAACQLKVDALDAALISAESVLRVQPENVKALYRKAKALMGKGDDDAAIEWLRKTLKIESCNKTIQADLARLLSIKRNREEKQKAVYSRMMGGPLKKEAPKTKYFGLGTGVSVAVGISAVAMLLFKVYGASH